MVPPKLHMHVEAASSAGTLSINTPGTPGIQGLAVAGTHGAGVKTPRAAAVAAATAGFDGNLHNPNGKIFAMGLLSMMLAAGIGHSGRFPATNKDDGTSPPVHINTAPIHTNCAIHTSPCLAKAASLVL
jgi:hypothetical protein